MEMSSTQAMSIKKGAPGSTIEHGCALTGALEGQPSQRPAAEQLDRAGYPICIDSLHNETLWGGHGKRLATDPNTSDAPATYQQIAK